MADHVRRRGAAYVLEGLAVGSTMDIKNNRMLLVGLSLLASKPSVGYFAMVNGFEESA